MRRQHKQLFATAVTLYKSNQFDDAKNHFQTLLCLLKNDVRQTTDTLEDIKYVNGWIKKCDKKHYQIVAETFFNAEQYEEAAKQYLAKITLGFACPLEEADTYWNLALCYQESANFCKGQEKEQFLHEAQEALRTAKITYPRDNLKDIRVCEELESTLQQTLEELISPVKISSEKKIPLIVDKLLKAKEEIKSIVEAHEAKSFTLSYYEKVKQENHHPEKPLSVLPLSMLPPKKRYLS